MNKKLTAKVQQLNSGVKESSKALSKCIVIEPESRELLLRKGTIYSIFEISSDADFDVSLVEKVIYDVLHDSYYQSDNISPIQSLEKAIVAVRDRIVQLPNESISSKSVDVQFNMLAGVLWGNVLYVVQYGQAESYLMREGEIRPINVLSEGSFSATSGVVKDEDVVIFCTQPFSKKYPPQRLLTMSASEQDLGPEDACLLLKFIIDTSISESELVDFGIEEKAKKNRLADLIGNLFKKFRTKKSPKPATTISSVAEPPKKSLGIKLKSPKHFRFRPIYLIPLLLLALAASIIYTLNKNKAGNTQETSKPQTPGAVESAKNEATEPTPQKQDNPASKIERVKPEVFYDIKIADPLANPTQIVAFSDTLVATDQNSGKIFISSTTTPKFEALDQQFRGINSVEDVDGKLGFADSEGYKIFDLVKKEVANSYKKEGLGISCSYTGFIYSISGDTLTKYTKSQDTLDGTTWGKSAEFNGAKSMAIAYSIYILESNDQLTAFTAGTKSNFEVEGLDRPFSNAVQVVTTVDLNNIYIADSGNNRVVVLDKKGNFVKQYKTENEVVWNNIKSIGINPSETTMSVLNDSKVYETKLSK